MLKELIVEIKKGRPEAHIIYIDKELEEFSWIRESTDLHNYVTGCYMEFPILGLSYLEFIEFNYDFMAEKNRERIYIQVVYQPGGYS